MVVNAAGGNSARLGGVDGDFFRERPFAVSLPADVRAWASRHEFCYYCCRRLLLMKHVAFAPKHPGNRQGALRVLVSGMAKSSGFGTAGIGDPQQVGLLSSALSPSDLSKI
jgi:hypothetical protein